MEVEKKKCMKIDAYIPTKLEQYANIISHGILVLPIAWMSYTLVDSSTSNTQYFTSVIYGFSLVGLFGTSTLFHIAFYFNSSSLFCQVVHRCDRSMIYIFIASSYTPWLCLKTFPNSAWSTDLIWVVWLVAVIGIIYQQLFHEKHKLLSTFLYVVIAIFPALSIYEMDDLSGIWEVRTGGIIYLFGVLFFKSDGLIPFAHAIWHIHVVIAAVIHYWAVSKYLIGKNFDRQTFN